MVEVVGGYGKKVVRIIEALQAPFMARKVHFVGDPDKGIGYPKHIWQALKDELTHIGMWSHDDLADALSLFFHKQVRVRPTDFKAHQWDVPRGARIGQKMSGRINPASISNWRMRDGDIKSDGTLRDDPFVGVIDAPGVDPSPRVIAGEGTEGDVSEWVAPRRK